MNTKEYIESGTLDLYVAGLLSVEEMRDVELKACQYPEIKTELETVQSSMERYAMKYAIAPPSGLKERIMKSIEGEGMSVVKTETEKSKTVVREISSARPAFSRYVAAASVALLILAGFLAWQYSTRANKLKEQVAQLQQHQTEMENQMDGMHHAMATNQQQVAMLSDTNTMRIAMKGTKNSPSSLAMIYWNKQSHSVYLDIKNLPATSADKQYQLWFIDPSGKPVSAGVFDLTANEWLKMVDAPAAVAFAVTLEPHGGSVNPTMDQMYVIGMVNS